jgi:SpoVK/Ycf46/Vps4 family AAA+-type ATPase
VLEYYKGILILTTNRPLDFDEAFYSRIHLTLRFPSLDLESKKAIWRNFFKAKVTSISDEELVELGVMNLNGRQIKNVVKLGKLLAYNVGEQLQIRHIRAVLEIINEDVDGTNRGGEREMQSIRTNGAI